MELVSCLNNPGVVPASLYPPAASLGKSSSLAIKTGSSGSIHLEKDTVNESEAVETFVSRHASNLGSDQPPSNAVVSSQSRSPLRKELSITPTSATSPIPGEKPPLPRKNSMNQSPSGRSPSITQKGMNLEAILMGQIKAQRSNSDASRASVTTPSDDDSQVKSSAEKKICSPPFVTSLVG